ncbi:MAG: amidohydrolase, partial [Collinsella sp.]|nr:amidohydrolase [Collinsella sp.]
YAIDFLAEPTQEELDGPAIAAVAETNPALAAKLRSAKATAAEARDAMHDARTARHAAIKGIHEARAAARHEEKHGE